MINLLQLESKFGNIVTTVENTIILLGRHGDIINFLPAAHALGNVQWIAADGFMHTLEGASYVKPILFGGTPDDLPKAIEYAKFKHFSNVRVAQCFRNPDKLHLCPSYNLESYRLANVGHLYGQSPLLFDNRCPEREHWLLETVLPNYEKLRPLVLVATDSISSPFPYEDELIAGIRGLDVDVIDLRHVHADRVYDLLALLDKADCLVTVDSLYLHLARASYCPTVCILNHGWCGSVPPPQTIMNMSYASYHIKDLTSMLEGRFRNWKRIGVQTVVNVYGNEERHKRARETWPYATEFCWNELDRVFVDHPLRNLVYFKDLIKKGMNTPTWDFCDVIAWTNDDTAFTPTGVETMIRHIEKFPFGCVRRDKDHIGRECFWFRRDWLHMHFHLLPDVVLGAPKCDLVLARWMRNFYGMSTTLENLMYDFPPVDLPPGIVHHEPHPSSWLSFENSPAAEHNEKIWNSMI